MAVYLFWSEDEPIAVGRGETAEAARDWAIDSTRRSGAVDSDVDAQVARIRAAEPRLESDSLEFGPAALVRLLRAIFPPEEAK